MSEPRPLSLGDLLRFDRERRSREVLADSSDTNDVTPFNQIEQPKPTGPLSNQSESSTNLASQINRPLDSQIDSILDSQSLTSRDSQNRVLPLSIDKNDFPPTYQNELNENLLVTGDFEDENNLAINNMSTLASQTKNLASQSSKLDSQKHAQKDDLAIKIAKSKKKTIAKKEGKGRWKGYEKNRDRSGERGDFFCRPRNAILKRAKHLMVEHGLKSHEFFELATTMIGEYLDSQKGKSLAILIATDNDRLMKTFVCDTRIINLYREVTGNRWTMTDDGVGVQFNELDFRIVEIAVIRTYIRWLKIPSKKPIKWFKYFKDEIELHAEELKAHSANTIDVMAAQARKLLDLAKQGIEVDA